MTIVWDTFERAARAAAKIRGIPDATFYITPHKSGTDDADSQRVKARNAVPEIARLLLADEGK